MLLDIRKIILRTKSHSNYLFLLVLRDYLVFRIKAAHSYPIFLGSTESSNYILEIESRAVIVETLDEIDI